MSPLVPPVPFPRVLRGCFSAHVRSSAGILLSGSPDAVASRLCPRARTHLSFSSCQAGCPTLSGRSRLLLYRPDCDSSFSCKAVIFLYLEVCCFFFLLVVAVRVGGWLRVGFPPFQMSLPRCPERRGSAPAHLRPPEPCTSAGRQPPLGFLFLIGTHPPAGHHVSLITLSHLGDGRDKLTERPKGLCFALTRTGATPVCSVRTAQPFQSQLELAKKENPPGCNELKSLPHCNLRHKGTH